MADNLIVALDGGGVRGLFTARLIERLELAAPGWLAQVKRFAGTSTGGILAAALAAGLAPARCVALYRDNAARIFEASWEQRLGSLFELNGPKYSGAGLRAVLTETFGPTRLGELKRDVLITACDMRQRTPLCFARQTDPDLLVVEACMRTAAAEIYFPPVEKRYIDGGNAANNPSLWALIHSISRGARLSSCRLLAIGTGNAERPPLSVGDWGARQWFEHGLLDLLFEMPAALNHRLCQQLLGAAYCRIDGKVDCALDATDRLDARLLAPADALDLNEAVRWLRGPGAAAGDPREASGG